MAGAPRKALALKNTALSIAGIFLMRFPPLLKFTFFSFWELYYRPRLTTAGRAADLAASGPTSSHSQPGSCSWSFLPSTGQAGACSSRPPSRHMGYTNQLQQPWSFLTGLFPLFQWFFCNFGGVEAGVEEMEICASWLTRRPGVPWNSDFYTAILSHGSSFWIWFSSTQFTESLLEALCASDNIIIRDRGDMHARKREQ